MTCRALLPPTFTPCGKPEVERRLCSTHAPMFPAVTVRKERAESWCMSKECAEWWAAQDAELARLEAQPLAMWQTGWHWCPLCERELDYDNEPHQCRVARDSRDDDVFRVREAAPDA